MNSHLDSQNTSSNQWIPLIEYSQKHNISISTLRRRIRAGSIAFNLKEGKYFLKDHASSFALEDHLQKNPDPINKLKPAVSPALKVKSKTEKLIKKPDSAIENILRTQQELYQLILEKDKKIEVLQNQISEFNTLTSLLEKKIEQAQILTHKLKKENMEIKNQLKQEKKLEEWLNP